MRNHLAMVLSALILVAAQPSATPAKVTLTGWIACDRCAPARVKAVRPGPVNRDCAQRCIVDGAKVVLIDESGRRLLKVTNPDTTKGQEGHYVRVTGVLDAGANALQVSSLTVLAGYVASCTRVPPEKP